MSDDIDNPPAFPATFGQFCEVGGHISSEGGMTLRDYFAAKAMAAMLACEQNHPSLHQTSNDELACAAYEIADAMLAERARSANKAQGAT